MFVKYRCYQNSRWNTGNPTLNVTVKKVDKRWGSNRKEKEGSYKWVMNL